MKPNRKEKEIRERTLNGALYIIENRATIRETARYLNVSKSCVYHDFKNNLKELDSSLYHEVMNLLKYNKAVRHLRGGQATQRKFKFEGFVLK